jgi:tetratricopeptide (TPR) repeat protein
MNAIPSRFIGVSPVLRLTRNLASRDTRNLVSANKQYGKIPCKVVVLNTTIALAVHTFLPTHAEGLDPMRKTLEKLEFPHLTLNESALLRCQAAVELKDRGDYEGAREVMYPFWKKFGERPNLEGLNPSVVAEVLLHVGILTRWIGSKNQFSDAQETAKDLINESIRLFETLGDSLRVAAARAELGFCYWWAGALGEARIMLSEAVQKLTIEGNTRANALIFLAIVEWSASRYSQSLKVLNDNAVLFRKIPNPTLKGAFHNQRAMALRKLITAENSADYFRRIVKEYEQADHYFKLAHNIPYRADVKNNVGNVLRQMRRFKEADKYIKEARRLAVLLKDKALVAQFDDTRAQLLTDEGRLEEAEAVARSSVSSLRRSGHQVLLVDSLITHAIVFARLGRQEQAQFTFQNAIEVAHEAGALNKAGLAALSLIEEIDDLKAHVLATAYEHASEWLADCYNQGLLLRFKTAGIKLAKELRRERKTDVDLLFNKRLRLPDEILKLEGDMISGALAKVNGRITHAAKLLGIRYQTLAFIIEARHPALLKKRTPVHRRPRRTGRRSKE